MAIFRTAPGSDGARLGTVPFLATGKNLAPLVLSQSEPAASLALISVGPRGVSSDRVQIQQQTGVFLRRLFLLCRWLVIGGWLAFGLIWRAARYLGRSQARFTRQVQYGILPSTTFHSILILAFSASSWVGGDFSILLTPMAVSLHAGGTLVFLGGLLFAIWARFTLKNYWSAATASIREGHRVIMQGPYRYVRHPIYTGEILMAIGTGSWAANWVLTALLVAGISLYNAYRAWTEERILIGEFGTEYVLYQHSVPCLIPRFRGRGSTMGKGERT